VTVMAAAGRMEEGLAEARQAIALADASGDGDIVCRTLLGRARLYLGDGRLSEAATDVSDVLERLPDAAPLMAEALGVAADLDLAGDDLWAARAKVEDSARRHRLNGDVSRALRTESRLSSLLIRLGAFEASALALENAEEECRLSGSERTRGFTLANLGHAQLALGNLRQAELSIDEALSIGKRLDDKDLIVMAHLHRAKAVARQSDSKLALKAARIAVRAAAGADHDAARARALAVEAEVLLGSEVLGEGLARAEEALAIRDQLTKLDEGETEIFAVVERGFRALGRDEEADAVAHRASERLQQVAALITDDTWRERFLSTAEAHRARILGDHPRQ
jgi:tetratricopeptide (TPR) repeat protein